MICPFVSFYFDQPPNMFDSDDSDSENNSTAFTDHIESRFFNPFDLKENESNNLPMLNHIDAYIYIDALDPDLNF